MYRSCLFLLTGVVLAFAYDDLSKNKVATQSTTALSSTDEFKAGKAVDRDVKTCTRTLSIDGNSPDKTVWWKVDLGGVYNIYSVNILFKNYIGHEIRQRGRFAGFSLFVSNDGSMDSSSLCYKDGPQLPSLNFSTNCLTSGRYVNFYNERLDGTIYPENYETATVYIELCEVIVQGCKIFGVYGNSCEERCPSNCRDNVCHIQNGTCFGCKPGWRDMTCNNPCKDGFYGQNCLHACSSNCKTCNPTDGTCSCMAGWMGSDCSIGCIQSYGEDCRYPCSKNCVNQTCNRFHGICQFGCESGYHGQKCDQEFPSTICLSTLFSGFIGASVSACVFITTSVTISMIRRKRSCFSGRPNINRKESPYAERWRFDVSGTYCTRDKQRI